MCNRCSEVSKATPQVSTCTPTFRAALHALCLTAAIGLNCRPSHAQTTDALSLVSATPRVFYTVQIAAKPKTDALQIRQTTASLRAAGWSPIFTDVSATSPLTRVCVGRFPTAADATWWRLALRKRGYAEAFVHKLPYDRAYNLSNTTGPITAIFSTPATFVTADAVDVSSQTTGMRQRARDQYQSFLSDDPESNTGDESETTEALQRLLHFANGEEPVTTRALFRARMAVAHLYQYGPTRRWLTAYHAYGEAMKHAPHGSAEEAECLLQRAAVLMELAKSGVGSLEDCRLMCAKLLTDVPSRHAKQHAVAGLIYAEALFDDGKVEDSIPYFLAVQQRWPTRQREVLMAQVYLAISYAKLGIYNEAEQLLQDAQSINAENTARFKWRGRYRDPQRLLENWRSSIIQRRYRATHPGMLETSYTLSADLEAHQ